MLLRQAMPFRQELAYTETRKLVRKRKAYRVDMELWGWNLGRLLKAGGLGSILTTVCSLEDFKHSTA